MLIALAGSGNLSTYRCKLFGITPRRGTTERNFNIIIHVLLEGENKGNANDLQRTSEFLNITENSTACRV